MTACILTLTLTLNLIQGIQEIQEKGVLAAGAPHSLGHRSQVIVPVFH
jgi:hypothetical protein